MKGPGSTRKDRIEEREETFLLQAGFVRHKRGWKHQLSGLVLIGRATVVAPQLVHFLMSELRMTRPPWWSEPRPRAGYHHIEIITRK